MKAPALSALSEFSNIISVLQRVQYLTSTTLLKLLGSKKINFTLARKYCVELVQGEKRTIGFKNANGAYESLNGTFFGESSYSLLRCGKRNADVMIFQNFIDLLSVLTILKKDVIDTGFDVIVLSSNSPQTIFSLIGAKKVFGYFDNGQKGNELVQEFQKADFEFFDRRAKYKGFENINQYLQTVNSI